MTTPNKVLSIAAKEIGYSRWDDPQPGTKYGRWYADLIGDKSYGVNGVPYCAMYVSWVLAQAGVNCAGFPGAYTPTMLNDAKRAGSVIANTRDAQPGDIVYFNWNGGVVDHVGIVEKNGGYYLQCIEGNTSPGTSGSQGNGGGVYRRTRNWNVVAAIVRPNYIQTQPSKPLSQVAQDVIDGKYGNDPQRSQKLRAEGYDPAAVQAEVNRKLSGKKTLAEVAQDVIDGKYGNNPERSQKLKAEGYDPAAVQAEVNKKLLGGKKTIDQIAQEVIDGKWGNGVDRQNRLKAAGYDPAVIQKRVNELL